METKGIVLEEISVAGMEIRIKNREGSPLVMHNWSVKAREMMRNKKLGGRTKDRTVLDSEAEAEAAAYRLEDGRYGIPISALRGALHSAAHKDLGIPKTLIDQGLFFLADGMDRTWMTPLVCIESPGPKTREDTVRVGMGSADLRYRPSFLEWGAKLRIEYRTDQLTAAVIVNLLDRAGFSVGLCEGRPERGGDWGRFEISR